MDTWQRVDSAESDEARRILSVACGSSRWVERMVERRPFGSRDALLSAAREVWLALDEKDWRQAFACHPAIGDRRALAERFPESHHLSAREQSGVDAGDGNVIDALAGANRDYFERFGYLFIVCASGRTAAEMLADLRRRLTNEPAIEIRIAAEEQAKITALRLQSQGPTSVGPSV